MLVKNISIKEYWFCQHEKDQALNIRSQIETIIGYFVPRDESDFMQLKHMNLAPQ